MTSGHLTEQSLKAAWVDICTAYFDCTGSFDVYTHWIAGSGTTGSVRALWRKKFPFLLSGIEPRFLGRLCCRLVAIHLTVLSKPLMLTTKLLAHTDCVDIKI